MIAQARLRQALQVLEKEYIPGSMPLSRFLQNWYKANRQMGSRDRKTLSNLLYLYFRTYYLLEGLELTDHLIAAQFLLGSEDLGITVALKPHWLSKAHGSLAERYKTLQSEFPEINTLDEFPFSDLISKEIDSALFSRSFMQQPKLFVRLHKSFETQVRYALESHHIDYEEVGVSALAFGNRTSLDLKNDLLEGALEIQDLSSQETAILFKPGAGSKWWDACAGSGGKSLLLYDTGNNLKIHASDYRGSILVNLKERFLRAGVSGARVFQADLLEQLNMPQEDSFDGIILDVPCSGSGTWSRTPESAAAFDPSQLDLFSVRQLKMAQNVIPSLHKGGALIYITCSVFNKENEWVTGMLCQTGKLRLEEQRYFRGYQRGADTLFGARFIKL